MIQKVIIWDHYKRENGTSQLKIRITVERKASYYPLDIYLFPKEFNDKAKFGQWVTSSRPNCETLNSRIKNTWYKIEQIHSKNPNLTAKDLCAMVDDDSENFHFYYQQKIDYSKTAMSYHSYKRLCSLHKKLKEYSPDLSVKGLNLENFFDSKKLINPTSFILSNINACFFWFISETISFTAKVVKSKILLSSIVFSVNKGGLINCFPTNVLLNEALFLYSNPHFHEC